MEAEQRNCQARVFSLWGSGIALFQSSKSHTILYTEAELQNFKSQFFLVRKRNFKPKNIPCVEVELQNFSHIIVCVPKRNFKSYNSLYVESLWFLMQESEVPGSAGPKTLCKSHLGGAVLNCANLAVAPTRIVLFCSVLIKHDRIS